MAEANQFVADHHRHSKPIKFHRFSIAAVADDRIVGVGIVGRPVARHLDDTYRLEANRICTNGYRNACSFLYGAAAKGAFSLGYSHIITYIREDETGVSLRAAGWELESYVKPGQWTRPSRERELVEEIAKSRWGKRYDKNYIFPADQGRLWKI